MVQGNICISCDHQVAILECPQCLQKHYCSTLCQRAHARQIGQLCPSQRRSGNIITSDRNQPHDGRSSELVVPIVVDNTVSPHSRSVTLPSIVHTVTRSMERTDDQYTSSRLPVLQGPSHEADQQLWDMLPQSDRREIRYSGLYQQAMVLISDGRINEAIALLEEVSRKLSDSHGVDHPLVRVAKMFIADYSMNG
jgi:hypothetical protein